MISRIYRARRQTAHPTRGLLLAVASLLAFSVFGVEKAAAVSAETVVRPRGENSGGVSRPPSHGDSAHVEILSCQLGVGGAYKLGLWTPVGIVFRSSHETTGRVGVSVPDGFGNICTYQRENVRLRAGVEERVEVLVQIGQPLTTMGIQWRGVDGSTREVTFTGRSLGESEQPITVPSHAALLLWIGPGELKSVFRDWTRRGTHWRQVTTPSQLPRHWLAYQAFRCVVLCPGNDERFVQELAHYPEAIAALQRWVEAGGKLILSGGPKIRALVQHPGLLEWATPGAFVGTIPLRRATSLESLVKSTRPVVFRRSDVPLAAQQYELRDGVVTVREGNIPVVIRRGLGLGTIVLVTIDLTHRALLDWPQWDRLVAWLAGTLEDSQEEQTALTESRSLMHYGYSDLAGQLRAALEVFPGIPFLPFAWVALLTVIYLLVVGPLDYWFSGSLGKHRRWTWLSFPAVLVLASAVGVTVAFLKGNTPHLRELACVDLDFSTGTLKGSYWANIYSPRPAAYHVWFSPGLLGESPSAETHLGWLGIPGRGLGGMESSASVALLPVRYTNSERAELRGFPVAQWATRGVWAVWVGDLIGPVLEWQLEDREGILRGQLMNKSPFTLEDCVLVYGSWAYPIGNLGPGSTWETGLGEDRRELRSWLNGRQVLLEGKGPHLQTHQQVQPYDQASRDVPYIMRMITFYQAAGGRAYTQLTHQYWPNLDITDAIFNGRAILVGRIGEEKSHEGVFARFGANVSAEKNSFGTNNIPVKWHRDVFFRFLIPVTPRQGVASRYQGGSDVLSAAHKQEITLLPSSKAS